jgi:hypothetical protein
MPPKWIFIVLVFAAGLYTILNYDSSDFREGFGSKRCPDILTQDGEELVLRNTKLSEVPGVNPVRFKNLEEYAEFVQWQKSQGIDCPVLFFQKSYDAQSHEGYLPKELPPLEKTQFEFKNQDADNPPFEMLSYPAMDPMNQDIGARALLDEYHYEGESRPVSADAMDSTWGGANFSMKAVEVGTYKGNEVYKPLK